MHQRKLDPRWTSTFVACEAALQLSRELLCWVCSARAVKSIQENSQDDSWTCCGREGCRDLTEGVKRGAVMTFPAALWCGRSITSSFIYPWQGYLACHCRFFILGEHVCVRYRKLILLSTEDKGRRSAAGWCSAGRPQEAITGACECRQARSPAHRNRECW